MSQNKTKVQTQADPRKAERDDNHEVPFQASQCESLSNERQKLLLRPDYDFQSDTLFGPGIDAFNS